MKIVMINEDSKLLLIEKKEQFYYSCKQYELMLACEKVKIMHHQQAYYLEENTMLLLKPNQLYDVHTREGGVLLLCELHTLSQVVYPYQFIHQVFQEEHIRSLIMSIVLYVASGDIKQQMLLTAYRSTLSYEVLNQFQLVRKRDENELFLSVREERMKRMFQYICEHYQEQITLVKLADLEGLTPQYLSKFFPRCFGMTFLCFLMNYRLQQAIGDVQNTNIAFLKIAMKHGFQNVRSFISAFKQCFGETPSKYRQKYHSTNKTYMNLDEVEVAKQFLISESQNTKTKVVVQNENNKIVLDANHTKMHSLHTWRNLITVGRARLLLVEDIRIQLKQIQTEIGFSYIRFHGIFNDDMHVYEEDAYAQPVYNFNYVNDALDFVLRMGLKPFVELGFMPSKLAYDPSICILNGMFIVSKPKDQMKWKMLVREFLRNCINRYGLDNVKEWRFEFWNSPTFDEQEVVDEALLKKRFWQGSLDEYLSLYKITYDTLKEINTDLLIGGPSIEASQVSNPSGMQQYLQFMRKHNCFIDFLDLHFYPPYELINDSESGVRIENFVSKQLDIVHSFMKKQNLNIPFHITEWNLLFLKGSFNVSDSCYKAVYIIKTILENLDRFDSLGYWTFTDYTETIQGDNNHIFNGNIGLFTNNGIRKAAYNAFVLLRKLGDHILASGEGYCFARKGKNYQVLLYLASHYDKDFREATKQITCYLDYCGIEPGDYEKKTYFLNEHSGSSYDVWNTMGIHHSLMEEDVLYLKGHSMMSYTREDVFLDAVPFQECYVVKENEAILVEFIYKF